MKPMITGLKRLIEACTIILTWGIVLGVAALLYFMVAVAKGLTRISPIIKNMIEED